MQVLTAAEMADADRRSAEQGVSVAALMENAGGAVARFVQRHFAGAGLAVVLCGKGNNGGDGFVAARELARADRPVRVALLGKTEDVKGEAAVAMQTVREAGVEFVEVAGVAGLREALAGATLVLDAVVGTGFKPPLRGVAAEARAVLAESKAPVVAVDLPSGWDADSVAQDSGEGEAAAFRADAVVTFVAPKKAHVFGHLTPGKTLGSVVVAGIGTPGGALPQGGHLHWAGAAKALAEKPRGINGNKGKFGHVLIIGGSFGKAGAPAMASLAAMRTGAGLTTAAVPREIVPTVAAVAPELMCVPLERQGADDREQRTGISDQESGRREETAAEAREAYLLRRTEASSTGAGGLSLAQLEPKALTALLKGIKVVGLGPGLGQEGSTPEFVRTFVERCPLPTVIDADALNAFAGKAHLLGGLVRQACIAGTGRTLVLTPHPGEMARLLGVTVKEVEADRENLARKFATEHGVTLVLKGWRTLIAHPDGRVAVNTTGNPSMAKGGSGDILTGIVAAMLAQYGESVAEAVEAAVYLHGLAGDFAAVEQDEHTVLATDTVRHLSPAFRARVTDADGFTWITGQAAALARAQRQGE